MKEGVCCPGRQVKRSFKNWRNEWATCQGLLISQEWGNLRINTQIWQYGWQLILIKVVLLEK